eukprot:1161013-Pelagomonas_calceolata.AAC.8
MPAADGVAGGDAGLDEFEAALVAAGVVGSTHVPAQTEVSERQAQHSSHPQPRSAGGLQQQQQQQQQQLHHKEQRQQQQHDQLDRCEGQHHLPPTASPPQHHHHCSHTYHQENQQQQQQQSLTSPAAQLGPAPPARLLLCLREGGAPGDGHGCDLVANAGLCLMEGATVGTGPVWLPAQACA